MCGICGIFNPGADVENAETILPRMLSVIQHRGPDDEGVYFESNIAFGMRRLSIIDLSTGQQPFFNEDGGIVVVCNGEIYNHSELRESLIQKHHFFKSVSDIEVIVHLYEEYGTDFVNHLRGMFSLALWDKEKQVLLLVRDRIGIKPLYYYFKDNLLVFGSEIKAILQHPLVKKGVNLLGLSDFLTLKYVPAPLTMFDDIFLLEPGHMILIDQNTFRDEVYWDLKFHQMKRDNGNNGDVFIEELDALLRECVGSHLMSDVPFGAFLSGGLDSSTVVAMMSQILSIPVKTFSIGYLEGGDAYNELPFAQMVAEKYQTEHHEVYFDVHDFIDLTGKVIWYLDQPIADQASLATYKLSEYASHHVKMVLTGEGGDELFAGYARYQGEQFLSSCSFVPHHVRKMVCSALHAHSGLRRWKLAAHAFAQKDEIDRHVHWFCLFNDSQKTKLLNDEVQKEIGGSFFHPREVFHKKFSENPNIGTLNRMLYVDTKLWLPDDLLIRGDKTSMAAGIEGRVPILDHKLVEFAASLPENMKLNRLTRKYALKKVAEKILPDEVVYRKKAGFPMPVDLWMRGEANEFLRDVLSYQSLKNRGHFNPLYVQELIEHHEKGIADNSTQLWALMNVELWHQTFFD